MVPRGEMNINVHLTLILCLTRGLPAWRRREGGGYGDKEEEKRIMRSCSFFNKKGSHNIEGIQETIGNTLSYQEPEKNLNLNVKRQSTDVNSEINQILELSDKDF